MHDYISLNLFSISSYISLALLIKMVCTQKNTPNVQDAQYAIQFLADIVFMLFLIAAALFLVFFVIEFIVRKKVKTEFFDINIENKVLRALHIVLFYIGAIVLPLSFIFGVIFYN